MTQQASEPLMTFEEWAWQQEVVQFHAYIPAGLGLEAHYNQYLVAWINEKLK